MSTETPLKPIVPKALISRREIAPAFLFVTQNIQILGFMLYDIIFRLKIAPRLV